MALQIEPPRQTSRPHIYELDPLRVVTILCVAGVHVAAFTVFLNHSTLEMELQNAFVVSLHYTRELFLFVTGFALTYVYYGKPFQFKHFWTKRSIGTILPYCIWSAVYIWVNLPQLSFGQYLSTTFFAILNGSASYQLYYILLTIQFYIILPVFLLFLKRVKYHLWTTLSISFLIQLVLLYLDYHSLQAGSLASTGIWQFIIVSRLVGRSRSSERLNNVGVRMKQVFIHTSATESKPHEHKPPRDMQAV